MEMSCQTGKTGTACLFLFTLDGSRWVSSFAWMEFAPVPGRGAQGNPIAEPAAAPQYPQKYYHSFKGDTAKPVELHYTGQGAPQYVKFEPEGLRITLPAGSAPGKNVSLGLMAGFRVQGDCEITTAFEILAEPTVADAGSQTRFTLRADLDRPGKNMVTLSRRVAPDGNTFFMWWTMTNETTGNEDKKNHSVRATTKSGRLRLVRTRSNVASYVADGDEDEFHLVQEQPFGPGDLKDVGIVAATGSPKATLDVRVFDLLIRAKSFSEPDAIRTLSSKSASDSARTGPAIALVFGLLFTVILGLGLWFYVRRRRSSEAEPAAPIEEN